MQAPSKSPASAVAVPESAPTIVRMLVALLATVTLLFIFRPTVVRAQEPVKPAAKPAETRHPEAKHSEAKPAEAKHAEAQHAEAKPADAHAAPAAAKPAAAHAAEPAAHAAPAVSKPAAAHPPETAAHAAPAPAKPAAQHAPEPASHAAPPQPPAAHAPVTTTGSAQGALAEQTAGKADAAPKDPAKAAPRAVRPAAAKVTTVSVPAKAQAEPSHGAATHAPEARVSDAHGINTASDAVAAHDAPAHESASDAFPTVSGALAPPRIWGPNSSAVSYARGNEPPTVFISKALDEKQADVEVEALMPVIAPRARSAEYASAPFAIAAASLASSGIVGHQSAPVRGLRARATAAVTKTEVIPRRLQLLDESEITLPAGATAKVGDRYVTVDGDRLVKSATLIAVPTAVLEVVNVDERNVVTARVVQLAGAVQEGQRVLAIEGNPITTAAEVVPLPRAENAPATEVLWVNGDGTLAAMQAQLVLSAGEQQGVKVGDQYALVKRAGGSPDGVEQRIAVVRVVRVTAYGSSAIVVRQDQPGLAVGVSARLIGRVQ